MIIDFRVPGIPVGQPRPEAKVEKFGKKSYPRLYYPEDAKVKAYKQAIADCSRDVFTSDPLRMPVGIVVDFVFPRVKRLRHDQREVHIDVPDLDNVEKAVKDSLNGIVWRDDRQVVLCLKAKWYAAVDESPHTRVQICTTTDDFCHIAPTWIETYKALTEKV